jgi:hypothetical protein
MLAEFISYAVGRREPDALQCDDSQVLGRQYRDRLDWGDLPCIPPHVLGPMVERILLRARVARDERQEARGAR